MRTTFILVAPRAFWGFYKMISVLATELKKQFEFAEDLESTLCWHIQKKIYGRTFSLSSEADREVFLNAGGHSETGCPKVCGIAAQVAS